MVLPLATDQVHVKGNGTLMGASMYEDDDSSTSSQGEEETPQPKKQRKRKNNEEDENEADAKKRKNREAARRCRERKQKQTDSLKKRNQDLEKENCQLAKERETLRKRCLEYVREIEQHKAQGCRIPHFNPPCDTDLLLNPITPPSPTLSESGASLSPCPTSPGASCSPPPRPPPQSSPCPPLKQDLGVPSMPLTAPTPVPMQQGNLQSQKSQSVCFNVKDKNGSYRSIMLDKEAYRNLIEQVLRARAQQQEGAASKTMPAAATATPAVEPQQTQSVQPMQGSYTPASIALNQSQLTHAPVEAQREEQSTGHRSDAVYEDLMTVLKGQESEKYFELTPVCPDEVFVKQEPQDSDCGQENMMDSGVMQEVAGTSFAGGQAFTDASSPWASTGQQIRAGMETLTYQEDYDASSRAQIQDILDFLKKDDTMYTITATNPATAQIIEQASGKIGSIPSHFEQAAKQQSTVESFEGGQRTVYITNAGTVGSLSKANGSHSFLQLLQPNGGGGANTSPNRESISVSNMKNVKLRPNATQPTTTTQPGKTQVQWKSLTPPAQQSRVYSLAHSVAASNTQSSISTALPLEANPGQNIQPATGSHVAGVSAWKTSIPCTSQTADVTMHLSNANQVNTALPTSTQCQQLTSVPQQLHGMVVTSSNVVTSSTEAPVRPLLSETTSQILEYLKNNSIETIDSQNS